MRATDLADPTWLAATVRAHHRELGLPCPPARVDLLDVRIQHPHRPDSLRCRGWATVRVSTGSEDGQDEPVFLIRSAGPESAEANGTPFPGLPLRAWRFPDDPGLPALAMMTDPLWVQALLPGDVAVGHVVEAVRVVRWQPGVSAVLRCAMAGDDGRTTVYAKLLAHDGLLAVYGVQRRLYAEPSDDLRVAEPLGVDPVHRILWTREVVGRPLLEGGGSRDSELPDRAARQAGRCLAALHRSRFVRPDRLVDPADVVAEAAKKAAKIAQAQPRQGEAAKRLATLAASLSGAPSAPRRPLHGDFHLDQMLFTEHDVVLLDLDEMVTGDPALDLAELAVDVGMRGLPSATIDRFLSVTGESYERAGGAPPDPAVLRGYAAAELLNRCYRHLRRPVPGWEEALGDDLGATDAVLAGAVSTARRSSSKEVRV